MNRLLKLRLEILIVIIFVVSHLPSLGFDNFNTDAFKWKARIYDFGTGVFEFKFEKTLQKYHPGVTLMWLGAFGVKVYNLYYDVALGFSPPDNNVTTVFELDMVQKFFVVFAVGVTLAILFYALRKLFTVGLAFFAIVVLSLEPFFVALTRVLHLEGLLTVFMLTSVVWLMYYLENTSKRNRLFISAIFTALAILTKTSALFMLPFALGLVFFSPFIGKTFVSTIKETLRLYLPWLLIVCITFIALWPSMWTQPIHTLSELFRGVSAIGVEGEHIQYYFGKLVENPGPSYYLVVLGLRGSIAMLAGLIGLVFIYKRLEYQQKRLVFTILAFAFLYLVVMTLPTKKLDRYVLPSLGAFALVAGVFYYHLYTHLKFSLHKSKIAMSLISLILLYQAITLFILHPDYLSYYNPLFGGLRTGIFILEPKWMIGQHQILNYFTDLKKQSGLQSFNPDESLDALIDKPDIYNKFTVGFPEKYYTQIWPFIRYTGGWATIVDLKAQAIKTNYFVYPVWEDLSATNNDIELEYVDSIYLRNVKVYNVYKRINPTL